MSDRNQRTGHHHRSFSTTDRRRNDDYSLEEMEDPNYYNSLFERRAIRNSQRRWDQRHNDEQLEFNRYARRTQTPNRDDTGPEVKTLNPIITRTDSLPNPDETTISEGTFRRTALPFVCPQDDDYDIWEVPKRESQPQPDCSSSNSSPSCCLNIKSEQSEVKKEISLQVQQREESTPTTEANFFHYSNFMFPKPIELNPSSSHSFKSMEVSEEIERSKMTEASLGNPMNLRTTEPTEQSEMTLSYNEANLIPNTFSDSDKSPDTGSQNLDKKKQHKRSRASSPSLLVNKTTAKKRLKFARRNGWYNIDDDDEDEDEDEDDSKDLKLLYNPIHHEMKPNIATTTETTKLSVKEEPQCYDYNYEDNQEGMPNKFEESNGTNSVKSYVPPNNHGSEASIKYELSTSAEIIKSEYKYSDSEHSD